MPNPENIKSTRWKPGQSGNPRGYPRGVPNRSTIARKVLQMRGDPPPKILNKLKRLFPALKKRLTIEEIITMIQGIEAMHGDTQAYKALMDSAYGRPQLDVTSAGSQIQGDIQVNVETPEQAEELEKFIKYVQSLN